ncbi:hypothetical protein KKC94_02215 [Patescibacteria group bacterium]|nr:hypothetical protein [Patescibacteria group bacterium]
MAGKTKNKNNSEQTQNSFEQVWMKWYSPEFTRYERGPIWFFIAATIDAGLLAYAFYTHSWSMILVFALLPLLIVLEHRKKPKMLEVIISPYGIKFGSTKLAFSEIKRFWILHDPPYLNEIRLLTNRKTHPEIVIPLQNLDPSPIRTLLVTQIPEWEGKQESFLDLIIRILRLA